MRYVDVSGTRMAYRTTGRGDPVVFLHGNPTSSYLWRDVLGPVAPLSRWAHPDAVRGIAYLETLVAPVSWDGPNAPAPDLFGPLRTDAGEDMVLRDNVVVEAVLPAGTARTLSDEEMDAYRQPYLRPGEDRRRTWPRQHEITRPRPPLPARGLPHPHRHRATAPSPDRSARLPARRPAGGRPPGPDPRRLLPARLTTAPWSGQHTGP